MIFILITIGLLICIGLLDYLNILVRRTGIGLCSYSTKYCCKQVIELPLTMQLLTYIT
jgi:hypothetical protein